MAVDQAGLKKYTGPELAEDVFALDLGSGFVGVENLDVETETDELGSDEGTLA